MLHDAKGFAMRLPFSASSLKRAALALPTACAGLTAGCFYQAPVEPAPHDPYGTIAFDWRFGGIDTCSEAGVDEVDLLLLQGSEVVLQLEREPCVGGGLELTDIHEGAYDLVIDAYDRESVLLYNGTFGVDVKGGRTNSMGVVDLDAIGEPPPPPPADGDLSLFWGFRFPTDAPLFDCARAGVTEVDVVVTAIGAADAVYSDTYACADDGVSVTALPQGNYNVSLKGYGLYHGDDVLLYDSGNVSASINAGSETVLGDVVLERVSTAFADFDVAWSFGAESCASLGVTTIAVSFTRAGDATPEDSFEVACAQSSVLREVFVPGSYTVIVTGAGASAIYSGSAVADVGPGAVAPIDMLLTAP